MHRLIRFLCVFLSLCLLTAAGVTVAATVRLERYARAAEESPPVIPDLRGIGEPSVLYAYDPEDRAAARGETARLKHENFSRIRSGFFIKERRNEGCFSSSGRGAENRRAVRMQGFRELRKD